MSRLLRWCLPLLALLAASAAAAAPDLDARARAALALAVATRPAAAGNQTLASPPRSEYDHMRTRAIAERRPLLVWVGLDRPDLERARPDCLHYHCDAFPGAAAPCVVLGRPEGGDLWREADLPAAAADTLRPQVVPAPVPSWGPRSVCGPGGCR